MHTQPRVLQNNIAKLSPPAQPISDHLELKVMYLTLPPLLLYPNKPNCQISSGFTVTYCMNIGIGLAGLPLVEPLAQ